MKLGPDYPSHPVAPARFRFASWDRGQRVVLEKNPTYWKYPAKLERVIYRPIVEDQARLTELLTGGSTSSWRARRFRQPARAESKGVGPQADGGARLVSRINNQKKGPSTTSACARR